MFASPPSPVNSFQAWPPYGFLIIPACNSHLIPLGAAGFGGERSPPAATPKSPFARSLGSLRVCFWALRGRGVGEFSKKATGSQPIDVRRKRKTGLRV
ncbi:Uncharacterized protein TCM_004039 [Theobroma cacao]|uniref:Uncharacterized protein n=1 Tax=Theobroma cacao TaxID=3641 RepID=A0A061DP13_THECC|nr:Uncharacterized protein TCM_004039 [Theobroma cacao]